MAGSRLEPEQEVASDQRLEEATLRRLLATPPDHKTKPKFGANPEKRGRTPKKDIANKG